MRLVQLIHPEEGRKIAKVEEPNLRIIGNFQSIFDLADNAVKNNGNLSEAVDKNLTDTILSYDSIYNLVSDWKLLPSFDHPLDPTKILLSGTGLTHKASAENRDKMHEQIENDKLTDSMKIYRMGVESGHPPLGNIGVQPEWFYKGTGVVLKAHGETLTIPPYGDDGGEEPEIAGVYFIDDKGAPWRIGFTNANEFSDHQMESKNYLYLAPSKIRNCSIGPELVIDATFKNIEGKVSISRDNQTYWEEKIKTGEENMCHSLSNLEYHHFKYKNHRIPQTGHIHFFGADAFSFGKQIELKDDDVMHIQWNEMGRELSNKLHIDKEPEKLLKINSIV